MSNKRVLRVFHNCEVGEAMCWFVAYVVLFISPGGVEGLCGVAISPPAVLVKYGDPLHVLCNASSSHMMGLGWESVTGGTGFQAGVSSLPLDIAKVESWTLNPVCFGSSTDEEQCIETLNATVYDIPTASLSLTSSLIAVEGVESLIKCKVENIPPYGNITVKWYKEDEAVFTSATVSQDSTPMDYISIFPWTASKDYDGSHIFCEVRLNLEPKWDSPPAQRSRPHPVTVHYSPTFVEPFNETVELPASGGVVLNCTAKGNPEAAYSWHHPLKSNVTVQSGNDTVLNLFSGHSGIYRCTASNAVGSSTKYFTVVEATGDQTTFGILMGVFVSLGVLLGVAGVLLMKPDGTFSFNRKAGGQSSTGVL